MPNKLIEQSSAMLETALATATDWASSPQFYAQLGAIGASIVLGVALATLARRRTPLFRVAPTDGRLLALRAFVYRLRVLLRPLLIVGLLGIAIGLVESTFGQSWLVRVAQGLSIVYLLYTIISQFIENPLIRTLAKWVGIPIATLYVFGWLDDVTAYLDGVAMQAGNIRVSLLALLRTALFGGVLFWFGRVSNVAGKEAIRKQQTLDIGTREVFAKLFEIALFMAIFLLLLQVMGINLTALAVFGGALGVGLGFGLQQIASNFISGIIILLDRSITLGDYIELEDGRTGTLRELSMRYSILETHDGKDIMVPNEQFITTSFTNWTHKDSHQRYSLEFQVAYSTDLDKLFDNVRAICAAHPKVMSGENVPLAERPDAEIAGFGDSGIDILVEFWMDGIDDGENRVGADLLHAIWRSIQENGMEIPFPQREVRIIGDNISIGRST